MKTESTDRQGLLLRPEHVADLLKSGLSEETIARLKVSSVRPHDIKLARVTSAYRLPYFDLDGQPIDFERWKLFPPIIAADGHTQKYFQAAGSTPYLYLPPLVNWRAIAADSSVPLVIAEGEKKAAAGCEAGLATLGIPGVWCWRTKLEDGQRLVLPELDLFVWQGRRVEIVPDSDAWRPQKMVKVLAGMYALSMELIHRGAYVQLVRLAEANAVKAGLDDFLVSEQSRWRDAWGHLERWNVSDRQLWKVAVWYQRWKRKQERTAMEAQDSFIERVDAIRLAPGWKPFERKRDIADLAIRDLAARGRLVRTAAGELYFFNLATKTLVPADGEEFRAELYERFGLNATEEEARYVEADLLMVARRRGVPVQVHRLACWRENTQTLYVDASDGTMFVLDGEKIKRMDNGSDEVLFLADRRADPVEPDYTTDLDYFHNLFTGLSLAGEDEASKVQAVALLQVWVLGIFFLEALLVRPILALIGDQGSGKTTLGRRIGLVLYGPTFQVGSFRTESAGEDDFLAAITARRFVVFDNADARIRWLPDHLARLATGAAIERRELYTTNNLISFNSDCFVILTSRDPRWKREDVTRRLLPIRMATIQGAKRSEKHLQREIIEHRARIWGSLLTVLNRIVAAIRADTGESTSTHRLADFHWFGRLAAPVLGILTEFEAAMANLDQTQLSLLGENDERLDLFALWVGQWPSSEGEITLTTQDLYQQLDAAHPGPDRTFPFKSPTALGAWLGRQKDLIETQVGVRVSEARSATIRAWKFATVRCHRVMPPNDPENQGELDADTMTPSSTKSVSDELQLYSEDKRPNEEGGEAGPELETFEL